MIDAKEKRFVQERIYTSDQDYFFWSALLGEPFLHNGLISFFDGETFSLVGYPLDPAIENAQLLNDLGDILAEAICTLHPDFINYYGQIPMTLPLISGQKYRAIFTMLPDVYNVDLFVEFDDPGVLATRNARESIRKARAFGLECTVMRSRFLSAHHITLVRYLGHKKDLWLSDVSFLIALLSILRDEVTTLFEVRLYGQLAAFALVHEYFQDKPVIVAACSNREIKSASDALYSAIIDHYWSAGSTWLGLGFAVDEGSYRYKLKWGGVHTNLPFHQLIWAAESADLAAIECLHWPCRLLMQKAQSTQPR